MAPEENDQLKPLSAKPLGYFLAILGGFFTAGPLGLVVSPLALMAIANKIGRQLGLHPDERGAINAEMMSGDYDNLIKVMDRHFGEHVIMYK